MTRIYPPPTVVIIKAVNMIVVINLWRIATSVLVGILVMFLVQQKFVMDVLVYNVMKVLYA
jgi:hypothetical protein